MKYLTIVFIFIANQLIAQTVDLSQLNAYAYLGKSISYYEDKIADLSLREVQNKYQNGNFKKGKADILNFGNSASAFWIHLHFQNPAQVKSYLIVDGATIEQIDCYIVSGDKWTLQKGGSLRKPSPGVQSSHRYMFTTPASTIGVRSQEIWLRVAARNIMIVPIRLVRADDMAATETTGLEIIELGFLGIVFTLFTFNLFLYFGLKDRAYLYYCLYTLCFGAYVVGYFAGYGYILGDDIRILLNKYPHVFFSIAMFSCLLITSKFYDLKKISSILFFSHRCFVILIGIEFLVSLFGFKSVASSVAQVLGFLVPVHLLICGFVVYKRDKQTALYFILAWTSIMLAVVIYVLSLSGVLPFHPYLRVVLEAGAMVQFMFLAFALGQRYHLIVESERTIKEAHYKLIEHQNIKLEKLVEGRTRSLKETIAKLEQSDKIKNRLFSIVAHDLRTPFNSMLSILSSNNLEFFSFDELKYMLNANKKNFSDLKNLLDNLLHWARMQMNEVRYHPEVFRLNETIERLVTVYEPIAAQKKIRLIVELCDQDYLIYADKNHIELVIRNLLDNATKFTKLSETIFLKEEINTDFIRFSISNAVTDQEWIKSLTSDGQREFETTYGTNKEKGVGLGLSLCHDYLRRNNSRLKLCFKENLVTISFDLELKFS